jgi:hypothetical protein
MGYSSEQKKDLNWFFRFFWTIIHQEIILVQVFVVRDDQSLPGRFTDLFFQPVPSKPDSFDDNQAQFFLSCYP